MRSAYASRIPGLNSQALLNGVMFNITWLIIVSSHSSTISVLAAAAHLLLHKVLMGVKPAEWRLIALVTALGIGLDHLLFGVGFFVLPSQSGTPPLWLLALWPVLATTLMHAFATLQTKVWLAALLGGIGGAASYTAGTRLTDIAFFSETLGPMLTGLLWACLFPLLLALAARSARAQ